jgi:septum site-determining protein MinD
LFKNNPIKQYSNEAKMTACVYTIASGNLGTSLAMMGKKTIILDADIGMANLGLLIGLEKSKITLHEVLAGTATIEEATYSGIEGLPESLEVIPSGLSLKGFQDADIDKLKDVVAGIVEGADYVLIDSPAGITKDSVIPLLVANRVILVVNPDLASLSDALKIKALGEMLDRPIEGAVLNRVTSDKTELDKNKVSELLGMKVLETIPEDANVRQSAAFKSPVVLNAPGSPSSIAFKKLATRITGEEFKEDTTKGKKKTGLIAKFKKSLSRKK